MANKIDNVVDKLATQIATLVKADGSGTLKRCLRGVIEPSSHPNTPVLAMAVSSLRRDSTTWTAQVILQLVANAGGQTVDQAVTDLIAAVDAQVAAFVDSANPGGHVDRPDWELWYRPDGDLGALAHVGALGTLRVRVEDPLTIAEVE